jgi:hypothetical protein
VVPQSKPLRAEPTQKVRKESNFHEEKRSTFAGARGLDPMFSHGMSRAENGPMSLSFCSSRGHGFFPDPAAFILAGLMTVRCPGRGFRYGKSL